MLDQHEGDAGSVSGLMGATNTVMGSIGIVLVSLELWGRVELVAALTLGLALLTIALWLSIGQPRVRRGQQITSQQAPTLADLSNNHLLSATR